MHAWVSVGSAALCGQAYFLQPGFYLMDESEKDSGPPEPQNNRQEGNGADSQHLSCSQVVKW